MKEELGHGSLNSWARQSLGIASEKDAKDRPFMDKPFLTLVAAYGRQMRRILEVKLEVWSELPDEENEFWLKVIENVGPYAGKKPVESIGGREFCKAPSDGCASAIASEGEARDASSGDESRLETLGGTSVFRAVDSRNPRQTLARHARIALGSGQTANLSKLDWSGRLRLEGCRICPAA